MAAKKVSLMVGFIPIATKIEVAVDEESSGAHAICTGNGDHAPARVKQSVGCPVCEETHSSVWGFPQRGVERDGELVVLTSDEIRDAAGTPRTGRKGDHPIEISFHPREKVYAATVAADSVQNVYPDKGGEKAYALLANTLRKHPDIVAVMIWAPSSKNALWTLEVVEDRIVATKRHWPETVRPTVNLPQVDLLDMEVDMFDQLVEATVEDFDLGRYVDASKAQLKELVESKQGVALPEVEGVANAAVAGRIPDMLAALTASLEAAGAKANKPKPPKAVKKAPAKKAAPRKRTPAKKAAPAGKVA